MLIEELVDFCDKEYTAYNDKCGCGECNHPSGECSGSCYDCLYQIHFPKRFHGKIIKKLYDCPKMLYHYVCQYSYLYALEITYALNDEKHFLINYPYYHILSIGCGGCSDLMAFEKFYQENSLNQMISYVGFDVNELWKPIHNKIASYCEKKLIKQKFFYSDVFKYFKGSGIKDTNLIVISYLISYLYNNNQILTIDSFIGNLVKNVILKKNEGQKLLLVINDINTNEKGRDYFNNFIKEIKKYTYIKMNFHYRYFDPGNLYDVQKIGNAYNEFRCPDIPESMIEKYHIDIQCRKTIQLLIEVE